MVAILGLRFDHLKNLCNHIFLSDIYDYIVVGIGIWEWNIFLLTKKTPGELNVLHPRVSLGGRYLLSCDWPTHGVQWVMEFNFSPEEAVGREAGEEEEKCLAIRGMVSGLGKITQGSCRLVTSLNFLSSYSLGKMTVWKPFRHGAIIIALVFFVFVTEQRLHGLISSSSSSSLCLSLPLALCVCVSQQERYSGTPTFYVTSPSEGARVLSLPWPVNTSIISQSSWTICIFDWQTWYIHKNTS